MPQQSEPIVTFDLQRERITIEGAGEQLTQILEAVIAATKRQEHEKASNAGLDSSAKTGVLNHGPNAFGQNSRSSIREFAKKLSYRSFYDRIAALLYYTTRIDGKSSLSSKDFEDLFGLCGFKKPSKMYPVLKQARSYYRYVERTGRDHWALATAGENRALELIETAESSTSKAA